MERWAGPVESDLIFCSQAFHNNLQASSPANNCSHEVSHWLCSLLFSSLGLVEMSQRKDNCRPGLFAVWWTGWSRRQCGSESLKPSVNKWGMFRYTDTHQCRPNASNIWISALTWVVVVFKIWTQYINLNREVFGIQRQIIIHSWHSATLTWSNLRPHKQC